ncbi:MAG: hypothetical protein M3Q48_12180 [Actinomycetota bacterium]|nr:hypothetical protein [Actinomycetota bacterium]
MPDDAARIEAYEARVAELESLVAAQAETIKALRELNERLEVRVAELERQLGQTRGTREGRRRVTPPPSANARPTSGPSARRRGQAHQGQAAGRQGVGP